MSCECRRTDFEGAFLNSLLVAAGERCPKTTIAQKRFVLPQLAKKPTDFIVSGGGTRNATLMTMLELSLGCKVLRSDDFGLPSQAKEAAAFALLAWLTWHNESGNIPSATGANRAVILGSISHA